jgi:two-component system nitrate/nitrite response regulator NarL
LLPEPSMESPLPKKIRLLIVEDHPTVRAGIRGLLQGAQEIEVVGEAADGLQAVEMADLYQPDFMLLDMELPALRGDAVLHRVLQSHPGMRVLVLSSHNDREYIKSMLAGGALGYVLKDEAPAHLLQAIRSVLTGAIWLSPRVAEAIIPASPFEQALTWRELAMLQHLLEGKSEAEVAAAMDLTQAQVKDYLALLMLKFEAPSQEALIEVARKMLPPAA